MTLQLLLEMAWKSLVCAALALAAIRLMRSRSAAEKSFVAHLGLLAILLLPAGSLVLPDVELAAPAAVAEAYAAVAPAAAEEAAIMRPSPSAQMVSVQTFGWPELVALAYAIPAALLLLLTLVAVARLQRLRARAEVLVDPRWLTALAAAQKRLGLKHGTALLASDELASPISWGIVRPIIIVDREVARDPGRAEAIIAHELAHVARLDWLALLLGRAACALFWFNPQVWVLARRAHDLSEQAADDAVLRSDVPGADYAEMLVGAARHASSPLLLAANGVAPDRGSLGRRVLGILDPARSRVPVRFGWSVICLAAAFGVGTALAAVDPKLAGAAGLERGRFGQAAAARLAAIPTPQTRAIAAAIETQDWAMRRAKGRTLFAERRAVEPLLLALRDVSPVTRRIAVWGLSELRPPEAVGPLARMLGDEDAEVRAEAARALGDLGATGESQAIVELLRDPHPDVRRNAAHALGDLQDPDSRPGLEAALADPDPTVRGKAQWALRQIAEAQAVLHRYGGG